MQRKLAIALGVGLLFIATGGSISIERSCRAQLDGMVASSLIELAGLVQVASDDMDELVQQCTADRQCGPASPAPGHAR